MTTLQKLFDRGLVCDYCDREVDGGYELIPGAGEHRDESFVCCMKCLNSNKAPDLTDGQTLIVPSDDVRST